MVQQVTLASNCDAGQRFGDCFFCCKKVELLELAIAKLHVKKLRAYSNRYQNDSNYFDVKDAVNAEIDKNLEEIDAIMQIICE